MPAAGPRPKFTATWGFPYDETVELLQWVWTGVQAACPGLPPTATVRFGRGNRQSGVGGICWCRRRYIEIYIDERTFEPHVLESSCTGSCIPVADWREAVVVLLAHEFRHLSGVGDSLEGETICENFSRSVLEAWRSVNGYDNYTRDCLAWVTEFDGWKYKLKTARKAKQ